MRCEVSVVDIVGAEEDLGHEVVAQVRVLGLETSPLLTLSFLLPVLVDAVLLSVMSVVNAGVGFGQLTVA